MEETQLGREVYLTHLKEEDRKVMETLCEIIEQAAPNLDAHIWRGKFWAGTDQEILGYGTYQYESKAGAKGSWFMLGLARQKAYFSLYVNAVKDGQYLSKLYGQKLGKVKIGSSSIAFKKLADLDLEVFQKFIQEALQLMKEHFPKA